MILTIDLGTTTTKAGLWAEDGLVAMGRVRVPTAFPAMDRAEQDPNSWWPSVVAACGEARAAAADRFGDVVAVGFSTARQTIVPVTAAGEALGPALLWSDRRASLDAASLAASCGGASAVKDLTGVVLDGGAVAAKAAWLRTHASERLASCRWLLGPRELVLWHMSGEVATDTTVASASGLYGRDGALIAGLAGPVAELLPEPVAPTTVVGRLLPGPAEELGLPARLPVVVGAGDRPCEVLGAGASPSRAMVSWGTTANVSVPVPAWPDPIPAAAVVTRAAGEGWLIDCGVSAAGSLLTWLGTITGLPPPELVRRAAESPPGARGVVALPWLGGARAPWWRDASAAFVGLSAVHDPGDLARAAMESVAWDVARCLASLASRPTSLCLAGGGSDLSLWQGIITAVTTLTGGLRRSAEAASAGAAVLAGRGAGFPVDIDLINPEVAEVRPDPAAAECYRRLGPVVDRVAEAVIGLGR